MIVLDTRCEEQVDYLAFTADNRFLATSGEGTGTRFEDRHRGIVFWNPADGENPVRNTPMGSLVRGFVLHPGGRWAYAETNRSWGELGLIDLDAGKVSGLKCVPYSLLGVAASADGRRVIASVRTDTFPRTKTPTRSDTQNWLMCWGHSGKGRPKLEWERQRTTREPITYRIAFRPDGHQFVAYESRHWGPQKGWVSQLAIRDARDGRYLQKVSCNGADHLAVSPNGLRVVTRWGAKLTVWNATALTTRPTVIDQGCDPGWYQDRFEGTSIAFHPSGRYLAATSNGATVKLYDTETWTVAKTYSWNVGKLRSVALSPDGTLAAAGSDTGKVVVWDVDA